MNVLSAIFQNPYSTINHFQILSFQIHKKNIILIKSVRFTKRRFVDFENAMNINRGCKCSISVIVIVDKVLEQGLVSTGGARGWKAGGKAARENRGGGKMGVALGRSLYSLIRAVVRYERWWGQTGLVFHTNTFAIFRRVCVGVYMCMCVLVSCRCMGWSDLIRFTGESNWRGCTTLNFLFIYSVWMWDELYENKCWKKYQSFIWNVD